ncbi:spore germination protein [Sulfoacidibacillus thermotolerans]|uniref:Spore germination protein n=1 Tax=Sulfoacidibacillus thermotolerans TaxID=1765684 RepID=A0A2U3D6G2_SULT2|nr:spore germination protein [Sulfoacidibacillus thermotolerans]PWI56871.1 hypothetical protein BM613_11590 [Sulfoacidibacillus thermotolerans]
MNAFQEILRWIVKLSESESTYRTRFSLSPSASDREGIQKQSTSANESPSPSSAKENKITKNSSPSSAPPKAEKHNQEKKTPKRLDQAIPIHDLKRMSIVERRQKKVGEERGTTYNPMKHLDDAEKKHHLPLTFSDQVEYLQRLLHYPRNTDIHFVTHYTKAKQKVVTAFSHIAIDTKEFEDFILTSIVHLEEPIHHMEELAARLPCRQYTLENELPKLADAVIEGNVVLFLGMAEALVCSFSRFEKRSISMPVNEMVIRGAQEAFTESIEGNMSQLRRILRCPDLVLESITLKDTARTRVCVCSMTHVTNPRLLAEMHRRIANIGPVPLVASGLVEQYLEDHWRSIFPTLIYTERPDLCARYIAQGQVAVLVDNVPLAIIAPATFWMQLTTAEDAELRVWYANFLRFIRFIALLIALILPGVYVGLTNFQQEMIPSDLLIAMTAARQNLPFPTIVEVLILELSFELIREASVRVPHVIGSTIGIVGALILGQSAVDANLVSPVVVIVVALTGLGSYAIPNQSIGYAFRILRYSFTIDSFFFGFFGIALMFSLMVVYMSSMQSFGLPYLTPLAPLRSKEEGFLRKSVLAYKTRPASLRTLPTDQPKILEQDDLLEDASNQAKAPVTAKNSAKQKETRE